MTTNVVKQKLASSGHVLRGFSGSDALSVVGKKNWKKREQERKTQKYVD